MTVRSARSDRSFLIVLQLIGGFYLVIIVAMVTAQVGFTSPGSFVEALSSPEIRFAIKLSLIVTTVSAILSLCVAVPLGYFMSRFDFPRKGLLDALIDIPIVLPPLVVGLGLLILFQTLPGKGLEMMTEHHMGTMLTYVLLPVLGGVAAVFLGGWKFRRRSVSLHRLFPWALSILGLALVEGVLIACGVGLVLEAWAPERLGRSTTYAISGFIYVILPLLAGVAAYAVGHWMIRRRADSDRWPLGWTLFVGGVDVFAAGLVASGAGPLLEAWAQMKFGTAITYAVPSIIIAQFAVACAFAVRTMRVAFDQISPRSEQVAMTLGCTRNQAFWRIVVPEAMHGMVAAGTIAWARAMGEFGPVLVFSGATRFRTEVLSTSVFLELSVGNLQGALAVSLLMIAAAIVVLIVVRMFGPRDSVGKAMRF